MDDQAKAALAGLELLIKANQARWEQIANIAIENQRNIAAMREFLKAQGRDGPAV